MSRTSYSSFESVQDVAELDSVTAPTRVKTYQVKKKDSGIWTWSVLTGTVEPKAKPASSTKAAKAKAAPAKLPKVPDFKKVPESVLGKLHLSLNAFTALPVKAADFLFPSRLHTSPHLSTRQYARIVHRWVASIELDDTAYGTHTMRRTKASLIYRRTKNLRAVQLLLGHTKLESTVRYLGIEVDDALEMAEQTEV